MCPGTLLSCNDKCVDGTTDEQHCGGCDQAYGANEMCVAGKCEITCTDGGANWNNQVVGSDDLEAITCVSSSVCWAAGENGARFPRCESRLGHR
jgi:hypothetical protein